MTPSDKPEAPRRSLPARLARTWGIPLVLGTLIALVWMKYVSPTNGSAEFADVPKPSAVNGDRAYGYLKKICEIGPRMAGTEANTRQRNLVAAHFKSMGGTVHEQKFASRHPLTGKRVDMVNLVGSWFPERTERVVLGAHYDTRPFPDRDPDPANRRKPFIGANDGASGVALLMEIAHHLKESPTPWGVDLVLFDGEELVYESDEGERRGDYFLGSKEFARQYKAESKRGKMRYLAGFVLDMVGGKELTIPVEPMSQKLAGNLVREVWGIADRLNSRAFQQNLGREVLDDHLPLNDARIPTIDIIDFEFPYWHTANDVPEECSGKSLAEVGRVMTAWLNQPRPTKTPKR
ncbi:MAG: putative aminopeptidase [Planctomycetota bacterium]|nr:putative aminopeptidase [Planctomycetota bacterium]